MYISPRMRPCEHEIVIATIERQVANVVGDHVMQPAHAVLAGHRDFGPPAQGKQAAAPAQHGEFRLGVAIIENGVYPKVLTRRRSGEQGNLSWSCAFHSRTFDYSQPDAIARIAHDLPKIARIARD